MGVRTIRQAGLVLVLSGGLLLAGCSDDGGTPKDGGTETGGGGTSGGGVTGGGALTRDDLDAFLAAMANGSTYGEEYNRCIADKVKAEVDKGTFSADDVRDWSSGKGVEGPVQEFITKPEAVTSCLTTATTG